VTTENPITPDPETSLSFASDIKPLFRERDRTAMKRAFDLWSYDDAAVHGRAIGARLKDGSMPCDGQWPEAQLALFERWLNDGAAP
jgi:hypothetical protein